MRYIKYQIFPLPYACIYKVTICPSNISGTGANYLNALEDALRYEKEILYNC